MKITEYFDPKNIEHIKAYKELSDTGTWPGGFIPKGSIFPMGWHTIIAFKIANVYVDEFLEKK